MNKGWYYLFQDKLDKHISCFKYAWHFIWDKNGSDLFNK